MGTFDLAVLLEALGMDSRLELRTRRVGSWQMNTYALVCPQTNESVLIDPGDDPNLLIEMLAGSTPKAIWLTHTHVDHVGALAEMRTKFRLPLFAHPGPHADDFLQKADRQINDGELLQVGKFDVKAVYSPGHIDDQICYLLPGGQRAIVGDTIFEGGPGKTWSAAGFQQTCRTLADVVLSWPDEMECFPGHGPSFRLGDKRSAIQAFLKKDHGGFFGDATWEM